MATAAAAGTDRLGEILLRENIVTREQLQQALAEQKSSGHRLGYVLVKLGLVPELEITKVLARQYRMPAVDLSRFEVDPKILKLIPADMAIKHVVLPLKREGRTLTVAMADPTDLGVIDDLKFITRFDIVPGHRRRVHAPQAGREGVRVGRRAASGPPARTSRGGTTSRWWRSRRRSSVGALQAQVDEAPVVKLINGMLTDAVARGAQRHPHRVYEQEIRVRYRIDGALLEIMRPPMKMKAALISRIKILSDLNIAERRVPQDGRIKLQDGQPGDRLPRLDAADALRREDRAPNPRQGEPDARPREVRHRAEGGGGLDEGDHQPVRDGAGHRPDRLGQDDDALPRALQGQHASTSTS